MWSDGDGIGWLNMLKKDKFVSCKTSLPLTVEVRYKNIRIDKTVVNSLYGAPAILCTSAFNTEMSEFK